jgi:hypothetical protein
VHPTRMASKSGVFFLAMMVIAMVLVGGLCTGSTVPRPDSTSVST